MNFSHLTITIKFTFVVSQLAPLTPVFLYHEASELVLTLPGLGCSKCKAHFTPFPASEDGNTTGEGCNMVPTKLKVPYFLWRRV